MKKVYFVRHGITGGNEINAYQLLETPLSEKGRAQAEFLGERFKNIPFDVLISSTMERAQETARAIAEKTGHEIVSESLFHEILRPSVVRGKVQTDPEVEAAIEIADKHWTSEKERHSDEENFHDLKARALKAIKYLIERPEETMVVVTHGTILKMIISVMIRGKELEPAFYDEIDQFLYPENTGITWCEYGNKYHPNQWQLITWNDHAHLG